MLVVPLDIYKLSLVPLDNCYMVLDILDKLEPLQSFSFKGKFSQV